MKHKAREYTHLNNKPRGFDKNFKFVSVGSLFFQKAGSLHNCLLTTTFLLLRTRVVGPMEESNGGELLRENSYLSVSSRLLAFCPPTCTKSDCFGTYELISHPESI